MALRPFYLDHRACAQGLWRDGTSATKRAQRQTHKPFIEHGGSVPFLGVRRPAPNVRATIVMLLLRQIKVASYFRESCDEPRAQI